MHSLGKPLKKKGSKRLCGSILPLFFVQNPINLVWDKQWLQVATTTTIIFNL